MARYIMEEMPDIQKTGKRITYPKFARIDNASIKELAQRVGDVSGFSAGDIEGVLHLRRRSEFSGRQNDDQKH